PLKMNRLKKLVHFEIKNLHRNYQRYMGGHGQLTSFESIEKIFLDTFLVDTVNQKSDRESMAYGLELRVPFLDNEVAEFSAQLSPHLKFNGHSKKYLLRKLLEQKLPGKLSQRPKRGFSIPMREWLRG